MNYMRQKQWIICIFTLALCGMAHADLDTLSRLRSIDWEIWPDASYDLALMGENAAPFLLQALTDENREARWHAAYFLRGYADRRAIPGLTEAFLHDPDEYVRSQSVWALASTDAEYTAELMVNQLDKSEDSVAQNIAVSELSMIGDPRVIPTFVRRLEDPATRKDAAFALARFKDKRAVPALTGMLRIVDWKVWADYPWEDRDAAKRAMEALAQIGDESSIPILLKMLDSPLKEEVAHALPGFGAPVVPPLLEMMKQASSKEIRDRIANVLRDIHDPQLASTYGKIFLEAEDWLLCDAMAGALANMGASGIDYLLKGARQENCYFQTLKFLSTYNSKRAADAIAELALDVSNPFRLRAIQTLQTLWPIWSADLMTFALKLLRDADPLVRLYTINMFADALGLRFRELEVREATEALREATHDSDERVRRAASGVLASFSGITPLKLEIEMNHTRYRYDEQVTLKYRIINIGTDAVIICTLSLFRSNIIEELILKPEIRKPDGTLLEYRGPVACMAGPEKEDYKTLQRGEALSGHIAISEFYHPYQPGRYTAKLNYRPFSDGVRYGLWAWVGTLTSQEISFEIAPPSDEQFKAMLADLDITRITQRDVWTKALNICYQLGEIRNPVAIKSLQKLAFYKPDESDEHYNEYLIAAAWNVRTTALRALDKFPRPELTPMWIEFLDDRGMQGIAIDALTKIGDPKAIEPLRRLIFSGSDNPIRVALALKELGDDKGIDWLRESALRKLKHWDPKERQDAVRILSQIRESDGIRAALVDKHPEVRSGAIWWLRAVAEYIGVVELKSMLADSDPNVQKAVAYQLALLGNAAGLHLIQQDLNANDVETRLDARYAFLTARGLMRKR